MQEMPINLGPVLLHPVNRVWGREMEEGKCEVCSTWLVGGRLNVFWADAQDYIVQEYVTIQ